MWGRKEGDKENENYLKEFYQKFSTAKDKPWILEQKKSDSKGKGEEREEYFFRPFGSWLKESIIFFGTISLLGKVVMSERSVALLLFFFIFSFVAVWFVWTVSIRLFILFCEFFVLFFFKSPWTLIVPAFVFILTSMKVQWECKFE